MKNDTADATRPLFSAEHMAIWLVAVIGLSLSWAALWVIQQQLVAHKLLDFEWVAHNRVRALEHGIDRGLEAMTTVRGLYLVSDRVEREKFQVFASSLLERYKGIQALMWVPRVPHGMREEFEKASGTTEEEFRIMERTGHFELTPAAKRAQYLPVTYLAPLKNNEYTRGFDLGSIPFFADLFKRAEDSGQMTASGRIVHVTKTEGVGYGFMAVLPVFRGKDPLANLPQRDEQLLGFIVGLFRLRDLTNAAISFLEPRGVEILLLDASAPEGQQFLHFYASRLAPRKISGSDKSGWWDDEDEPRVAEPIQVADREWTIICGRTNHFRSAEAFEQGPWVALIAGLLFTVLLSFYLARIKESAHDRMLMQQRLIGSQELFRQMTETVDEVFWAITADATRLLYLSPAYERILGVDSAPEDKRQSVILDAVSQEDQARIIQTLHQIRRDRVGIGLIHRVTRADGTTRWVRTRGFPVEDATGHIYRIVGYVEDITERKLADEALRDSQAKLQDMFQQSPDVIMTVDRDGKILLMNRSMLELPADQAIGRSSLSLMSVPAEFRKWYQRALKKVIRDGKTEHFQYSTEDSQYWEGRIVPIRGDGPVSAAMVIATDVTEKRNLETQALRNARLASVGVLAAGVAHEINNPNNSIMFNASLVGKAWQDVTPILAEYYRENGDFSLGGLSFSEASESFPQLLSEISRSAERIKRIVQNLKHMARQDTGQLNERVNVQQVLEATLMILHNQIQKYTDTCLLDAPEDLPPVRGNSQQLEQVFINVLLNALQSLPDRGHGVFIRARFDEQEDGLKITIRDEGRGISERDLGRVTEPFFTTRPDSGGTGLGLSISHSIIEKQGGSMKFQSQPGKGTIVSICVPTVHS
jgi:PAS domain S-box-containing protein